MGVREIVERLRIEGDSSSAVKAAKRAEGSLTKAFFKASVAADIAARAIAAASDAIRDSVEAALENERTTLQLQAALRLQGREVESNTARLAAQASELEKVTNVSDEVIRGFQAQAVGLGVATDEVDKFVRASIVLAKTTGRDVRTAFEQLMKSTTGAKEDTLKLIPEIEALTTAELQAGKAVDVLNEKYGEFIDLGSRGKAGALATMTTAWSNMKEEIGKSVIELEAFKTITNQLARGAQRIADLFEAGHGGLVNPYMLASGHAIELADAVAEIKANELALAKQRDRIERERLAASTIDFGGTRGAVSFTVRNEAAERERRKRFMSAGMDFGGEDVGIGTADVDPEGNRAMVLDRLRAQRRLSARKEELEQLAELEKTEAERRSVAMEEAQARELALTQLHEQQKMQLITSVSNATTSAVINVMDRLLAGEKVVGAQIAVEVTRNLGRQMIGQGLLDVAKGISRGLSSYGFDPTAYALITHGGTELGIGATMLGGSLVLGNAFGVSPTGGGGGSRLGSGSGSAASAPSTSFGRQSDGTTTTASPEQITIIFNGPTTAASVGVAINDALNVAREQGLIGA